MRSAFETTSLQDLLWRSHNFLTSHRPHTNNAKTPTPTGGLNSAFGVHQQYVANLLELRSRIEIPAGSPREEVRQPVCCGGLPGGRPTDGVLQWNSAAVCTSEKRRFVCRRLMGRCSDEVGFGAALYNKPFSSSPSGGGRGGFPPACETVGHIGTPVERSGPVPAPEMRRDSTDRRTEFSCRIPGWD